MVTLLNYIHKILRCNGFYPVAGGLAQYLIFEEHAQDGRGVKLAAQRFAGVPSCLAASSRALCALEEHAQDMHINRST
jgi:hypothetical protein